jgi:hypothetical protein
VNTSGLSQAFADEVSSPQHICWRCGLIQFLKRNDFTAGAKLPAMLWVRHMGDGLYAVDNDKRWDVEENVLSDLVSSDTTAISMHELTRAF